MFYSYTRGKHKYMLVRFPLKINAPSSCYYFSKVLLQKRGMGYAKVIHKKERKKKRRVEKNWTSVRDIENNGYSDARLLKKR